MKNVVAWVNRSFAVYPDKMERFVYSLIFLFPIAGMSIRSWISSIFVFLVLLGLFMLQKERDKLLKPEKIFLWICVAYFAMFLVSSLVNGWGVAQTYYLGTELRFIFIIPVYLLLRRYPDCSVWLLRGAVVGGFVLFTQAYYDVFVMDRGTALGVYSKNIIGPLAVLIAFWGLYYIWLNYHLLKRWSILFILLSVLAALVTAGLSGSRGGYVGFMVTALACVMFFSKPRWMLASLAVITMVAVLFYQNSIIVEKGVNKAANEFQQYFQAEDHVADSSSRTSTGVRLEMLRTGLLVIRDNPILGIGPGNYNENIQTYIKQGKASPAIANYSHPHNTFMEVASSKGLLGLVTVLLLFYYPAFIFIKGYKQCKPTAVLGLIHVVAISVFSLTDHSVVLMNNYVSILLLGMVIFFSAHIRACKQHLS